MSFKDKSLSSFTRRQVLAGAGAAMGSSLLPGANLFAQNQNNGTDAVIFSNATLVTNNAERQTLRNTSLAVSSRDKDFSGQWIKALPDQGSN